MGALIITSLLLGSSLGSIFAKILATKIPFNIINTSIPGVTESLASYKTFDLIEFPITSFFVLAIFLINYFLIYKRTSNRIKIANIYFILSSLIIFIQANFVTSSGKIILISTLIVEIVYLLLNLSKSIKIDKGKLWLHISNGIFVGLWVLLIVNQFTPSIALPLLAFILAVTLYASYGHLFRFLENPLHALLAASIFFSNSQTHVTILGLAVTILILLTRNASYKKSLHYIKHYVYPSVFIAVIMFNPFYYAGNFDSVEEGFWLGWVQNMSYGKVIYRDFLAYHPPALPMLLNNYLDLTDYTIRNVRLFFHLMQIMGAIIYFIFVSKTLQKWSHIFVSMLIYFAITHTMVKNNVEIRVGLGLLSLVFMYKFIETKRSIYSILAGAVSGISLFVSTEVGLSVIISIVFTALLITQKRLSFLTKYFLGVVFSVLPFLIYLYSNEALISMIEQIAFYSDGFTKGYFNEPIHRAISTSFLRWHIIWQHLQTIAFLTQLTHFTLLASIMFVISLLIKSKESLLEKFTKLKLGEKHLIITTLFGFIMFRSVLGRSDYLHVLTVLIIAVPLLMYLSDRLIKINEVIVALLTIVLFVIFAKPINENFLSHQMFKFTTYGEKVEEYVDYGGSRSRIMVGKEVNLKEDQGILDYISNNTNKDDKIFVYPWNPEIYFLANRENATSVDIPYAFWSDKYQEKMISEIGESEPSLLIINSGARFGNMGPESLAKVWEYIEGTYEETESVHSYKILRKVD